MRFIAIFLLLIGGVCAAAWETHWLRDADADYQQHLQRVISTGDVQALQQLVQSGVDLDMRESDGTTPLLAAALFGREHEAAVLIDAGASIDATDHRGWTPCMLAAAGGYPGVLDDLIRAGANVNAVSFDGRTALAFARDNGHPEIVAMLLKAGAHPVAASSPASHAATAHTAVTSTAGSPAMADRPAADLTAHRHHHAFRGFHPAVSG